MSLIAKLIVGLFCFAIVLCAVFFYVSYKETKRVNKVMDKAKKDGLI